MSNSQVDLVVHATHEAGFKVGGIGAALDGLLGTAVYNAAVGRTVLVGPMNTADPTEMARLTAPANRLEIVYSSWHQIDDAPAALSAGLREIGRRFRVHLLYGRRAFAGSAAAGGVRHEVLLVDACWADLEQTNTFKNTLWHHYRIESNRYEWNEEFDLIIKAARPAFAALELLLGTEHPTRYLIAHEWMGLPLAFCAQTQDTFAWKLVYYAHEMPTARILVEDHPGHDTRFYNVLQQARSAGLSLEQLFGDRSDYFKHALVKQAARMDAIWAVGQWVKEELCFLGGPFASQKVDLVYNGLTFQEIGLEERSVSTARLQQYCQNLLGYWPDYVFTHVTRLVVSKALWRDLAVMGHLDGMLAQDDKRAVMYLLATSVPAGRPVEKVLRWEQEYGWPVVHHRGNGDLVGHEVPLYHEIESFNAQSRAVKIVLVNQFGWCQDRCGREMPAEMAFSDIRWGTHLEFGQSIYEPFGISQVEPLGFGALGVVSNVCGCVPFVEGAAREAGLPYFANLLQADYTTLPDGLRVYSPWDALWIGQELRDRLEQANSYNVALAIRATLPATSKQVQSMLQRGQRVGRQMSWDAVTRDYVVPALRRLA